MTITEPTTTGTDTLVELPLDRLAPHPRNIRRHSDVTDLARSIAQVGILEPLIVLPADGAGIHHLVAGHRRARAADQAGLTTAPCIIRNFDDEADVVLAMIGENTNQGRLSIVEEAQALAAVIDLKGGTVTARRLAKAVGHSETWVKSRLSLLALTDAALDSPPRRQAHPRRRHGAHRPGRPARRHRPTRHRQPHSQRVAGRVHHSRTPPRSRPRRRQRAADRQGHHRRHRAGLHRPRPRLAHRRRPPRPRPSTRPPQRTVPRRRHQGFLGRHHRHRDRTVHRTSTPQGQPTRQRPRCPQPDIGQRGRPGSRGTTPASRRHPSPYRVAHIETRHPQPVPDRRRHTTGAAHLARHRRRRTRREGRQAPRPRPLPYRARVDRLEPSTGRRRRGRSEAVARHRRHARNRRRRGQQPSQRHRPSNRTPLPRHDRDLGLPTNRSRASATPRSSE